MTSTLKSRDQAGARRRLTRLFMDAARCVALADSRRDRLVGCLSSEGG